MDGFTKKAEQFFVEEEEKLKLNYPGITKRRLLQELNLYLTLPHHDYNYFLKQLSDGVPLAYISGRSHFYNSEFVVTPDVLIPRFETELLVELAVKEIKKLSQEILHVKVIDVGTGSGAIAVTILQEVSRKTSVLALDISEKALAVARKNYFLLRFTIDKRFKFETFCTDRLARVVDKAHLIVSNPPYIKTFEDNALVHKNVLKYEPKVALFIDDDSYDSWFGEFFIQVHNQLLPNGIFLMEGHEAHLEDLMELAENIGFTGTILKDLTNRNRFLKLLRG